ncbi:MAG: IS1595 family transposase [Candidatus Acidiferrum sp.]
MADAIYTEARFNDDDAAREHLELIRWSGKPFCPHCGATDRINKSNANSHRAGLYHCGDCRQQFTVTVGTVMERSKVPLHKWLLANHMLCSSKKGVSAKQIERTLGVTYNTAWFMMHRLREAMKPVPAPEPMGGAGKVVEIDETFIGSKKTKAVKARGYGHKHAVLTLVERGGKSRSFHVDGTKAADLLPILRANIAKETVVMTDEAAQYNKLGADFKAHYSVTHSAGEYVRGSVHTNTVEGFYSVFKRGMKGVYQHCGENHLHRYVNEFDFRYSNRTALGVNDTQRAETLLRGIEGKRLTYRRLDA